MGNPWFSSPSLNDMPLAYRLRYARKSRTAAHLECARLRRILRRTLVPLGTRLPSSSGLLCAADRVGKYELRMAGAPDGTRKRPGGTFSRTAVTGLSGQAINRERKSGRSVRQYDLLLRCSFTRPGKGMAILHEKTQNNLSILYIDFSLL